MTDLRPQLTIADHIETLRAQFAPDAAHESDAAGAPEHWRDDTSDGTGERLANLRLELRRLGNYFPHTARGLERVSTDVFLIRTASRGLCRVMVVQIKGKPYFTVSCCPKKFCDSRHRPPYELLRDRAPEVMTWIYDNLMDGLTDVYGLTGFYPLDRLTTMLDGIDSYGEMAWYDAFASTRDPAHIVEMFSSGGGGYLLLDLNDDLRKVIDAPALRISSSEPGWTPENPVNFWRILDIWMAIGLADVSGPDG